MYIVQFAVLAVLTVLGQIECIPADKPPLAGICKTLPYKQLDEQLYVKLAGRSHYEIIYSTANPPYHTAVRITRDLIHVEENVFVVADTFFYSDESTYVYSYNVTYIDFVGYEVFIDGEGVKHESRLYVLAVHGDDIAVLFYRCSDDGDPELDYRGIEIASGNNLSEAGLQYLLVEDDTYNFTHGKLMKLPSTEQ